jgi:hypothetical protein
MKPLSDIEERTLKAAYQILTDLGKRTAVNGEWNRYVDEAQHQLGLIIGSALQGHLPGQSPPKEPA